MKVKLLTKFLSTLFFLIPLLASQPVMAFYSPEISRWLNREPIAENGGINLYQFVANNPLNYVDHYGLDGNPVMGLGGAWNSDLYGSGGSFYGPGLFYTSSIQPDFDLGDAIYTVTQTIADNLPDQDFWNALAVEAGPEMKLGDVATAGFAAAVLRIGEEFAAKCPKSADILLSKLSALRDAQRTAARTITLPDGRIRYYDEEMLARTPGPTRGASYVTEWDPSTGAIRSWMESYDQAGNVIRVHPKMINGLVDDLPHYPPTGKELKQ